MNVSRSLYLGVVISVLISGSAFAEKGGKDGNGHERSKEHHSRDKDNTTVIRIGDNDRIVLNNYLQKVYKKNCPPGLEKKHNGCQPPGQAKKYRIGYRLPDDIRYFPVPSDVLSLLNPAPEGYKYVRVDTDILLVGEATKKVIDAVTLLSAVGNQ